MRCRTCNYRLWNLTERRCPECGSPFRPSEFEFVPNSVQFCCPHCGQAYYGTGDKGHLVPAAFECARCGVPIQMDEMVLRPTAGVQEEQTNVARVPWLERQERGFIRAWLGTVGAGLVSPMRLMRALPDGSAIGPARGFAALTLLLTAVVGIGPLLAVPLLMGVGRGSVAGFIGCGSFIMVALVYAAMWLFTVLWALVAHALLRLTGPIAGHRSRTFQAIYYSTGANVVSAVPCLGVYLGWIWWVISAALMVKQAQRVHGGRAAFATLTLPALMVGGLVALYAWILTSYLPSANSTALRTYSATSARKTGTMLSAVLHHAGEHAGHWPGHAAELVVAGDLNAADFIGPLIGTTEDAVPVGPTTLGRLAGLPHPEALAAVQAAAQELPLGTVAYRFGDFVFVYRGVDLSAADPNLWVVVGAPNIAAGPLQPAPPFIAVGCADGSVQTIPTDSLSAHLAAQNALRAASNLPPLPDPMTVTHTEPGVAGQTP